MKGMDDARFPLNVADQVVRKQNLDTKIYQIIVSPHVASRQLLKMRFDVCAIYLCGCHKFVGKRSESVIDINRSSGYTFYRFTYRV